MDLDWSVVADGGDCVHILINDNELIEYIKKIYNKLVIN